MYYILLYIMYATEPPSTIEIQLRRYLNLPAMVLLVNNIDAVATCALQKKSSLYNPTPKTPPHYTVVTITVVAIIILYYYVPTECASFAFDASHRNTILQLRARKKKKN